jgi:glycosyltransferase involved in cell wall biosynthesis
VSKATYEDIRIFAKVPQIRLRHVVNGLDLDRINTPVIRETMRKQLGIPSDSKVIGFVARIRGASFGKKGIVYLLDAMRILIDTLPRVRLIVCGEDVQAAQILKKICEDKGICAHVLFMGYREDIVSIIDCCDILVCPSLFEGLPRVVLESMALGVPVVGSRVDGIPEVIDDGRNGLLVEPRDVQGLSTAMERLLADDSFRTQCSQAARQTITQTFTAQISAKETEQIYKSVLDS